MMVTVRDILPPSALDVTLSVRMYVHYIQPKREYVSLCAIRAVTLYDAVKVLKDYVYFNCHVNYVAYDC